VVRLACLLVRRRNGGDRLSLLVHRDGDAAGGARSHPGAIELYFSYVVSRRVFREQLGGAELLGLLLLGFGLVGIVGLRRGNSRLSPRYALQFAGERLTPNRMLTDQLT